MELGAQPARIVTQIHGVPIAESTPNRYTILLVPIIYPHSPAELFGGVIDECRCTAAGCLPSGSRPVSSIGKLSILARAVYPHRPLKHTVWVVSNLGKINVMGSRKTKYYTHAAHQAARHAQKCRYAQSLL